MCARAAGVPLWLGLRQGRFWHWGITAWLVEEPDPTLPKLGSPGPHPALSETHQSLAICWGHRSDRHCSPQPRGAIGMARLGQSSAASPALGQELKRGSSSLHSCPSSSYLRKALKPIKETYEKQERLPLPVCHLACPPQPSKWHMQGTVSTSLVQP